MMHHNGAVVTIREMPSKRPLREYDHTRSGKVSEAQVLLPFNTEFAIGFKFPDRARRLLELTIDGVRVTDGLIVEDGLVLERFIDSDRRFKFVRQDHPSVMDPTSEDNGLVEIVLRKEACFFRPNLIGNHPKDEMIWQKRERDDKHWKGDREKLPTRYSGILRSHSLQSPAESPGVFCCSAFNHAAKGLMGEAGATVEGSRSNQSIGTDVWHGDDGEVLVFRFRLRGQVKVESKGHREKEICHSCHKHLKRPSRYCPNCGARLLVGVE